MNKGLFNQGNKISLEGYLNNDFDEEEVNIAMAAASDRGQELIQLDLSHPDLRNDNGHGIPPARDRLIEPSNYRHHLDIEFHCEKEARAGDEITFLLNLLETRLDDVKTKNHFNLS